MFDHGQFFSFVQEFQRSVSFVY